ncbi:unnamed protein product [Rotaria sp. Silwood1]|nr:unnamed protein product [Rotaria sp. Silwood1]CAF3872285.1 unnamed protein product [Rotaria sp. Silwood1]CAF3882255.1 unnamed protein product [Rotaria sp. Silwood1]CAF3939732.1 unnamed protein product [Rotaria sp. Silwood1]CAF5016965.1 unnamed protein product [Rotaria sp. Silwood1]
MGSFDSEKVKRLLIFEKCKYKIIENTCPSKASWWRAFGFPARLNEHNQWERIEGFISCTKCMNTQIYNKLSGTKRLKEQADKCFPLSETTEAVSLSSSSTSTPSASSSTSAPSASSLT